MSKEKNNKIIEQINKLLNDNNLMLVPVTQIVGNQINSRCEIIEKPKKSKIIT